MTRGDRTVCREARFGIREAAYVGLCPVPTWQLALIRTLGIRTRASFWFRGDTASAVKAKSQTATPAAAYAGTTTGSRSNGPAAPSAARSGSESTATPVTRVWATAAS